MLRSPPLANQGQFVPAHSPVMKTVSTEYCSMNAMTLAALSEKTTVVIALFRFLPKNCKEEEDMQMALKSNGYVLSDFEFC